MITESPIPLYYQVSNLLRHRILDGGYRPGERVGTEMEMCAEFGVSRITIRQALEELERERLIRRRRGLGTFVADTLPKVASISFTGYLEDLFAQVLLTTAADSVIDRVPAGDEVGQALELGAQELVVRVARTRMMAGEPLAHTVSYLPLSVGASITQRDLSELPLMHVLEQRVGVRLEEAIQTVQAVPATKVLAERLLIAEGAPLLRVQRTTRAAGKPVEYVLTHYRGDRYQYTVRLGRISRGER